MIHELTDGFSIDLKDIIAISEIGQTKIQTEKTGLLVDKHYFKIFVSGVIINVFRDIKELIEKEREDLIKAWKEIKNK